jgi:mono/diheme cytochrome c family protein
MQTLRSVAGLATLAVLALGVVTAATQTTRTTKDGVYTEEQATRGKTTYGDQCSSRHGEDLSGVEGPSLKGGDFITAWDGLGLDALSSRIQDTMPANSPGSLTPAMTTDLLAFLLKSNGFAAGTQPLPGAKPEQAQIGFVKP